MCGIVGAISRHEPLDEADFTAMRDSLAHRGPEGAASAWFAERRIALGHRRLSFLDLSAAGGQPLSNKSGSLWIVYNGEIYNHVELRQILQREGHVFNTRTDTEVLLYGYEQWGERVVDRLKGMFAFAILDLEKKRLLLARDRFGIKPPLLFHHTHSFFLRFRVKGSGSVVRGRTEARCIRDGGLPDLSLRSFAQDYMARDEEDSPGTSTDV